MDAKEAKEIIGAGFAWANWTEKQKQAFKFAYDAIDEAELFKKHYEEQLEESQQTYDYFKNIISQCRCEECGNELGNEWSYTEKYGILCTDCKID